MEGLSARLGGEKLRRALSLSLLSLSLAIPPSPSRPRGTAKLGPGTTVSRGPKAGPGEVAEGGGAGMRRMGEERRVRRGERGGAAAARVAWAGRLVEASMGRVRVGRGRVWVMVDAARKERVREDPLLFPTRESVGALSPLSRHGAALSPLLLSRAPFKKCPRPRMCPPRPSHRDWQWPCRGSCCARACWTWYERERERTGAGVSSSPVFFVFRLDAQCVVDRWRPPPLTCPNSSSLPRPPSPCWGS